MYSPFSNISRLGPSFFFFHNIYIVFLISQTIILNWNNFFSFLFFHFSFEMKNNFKKLLIPSYLLAKEFHILKRINRLIES